MYAIALVQADLERQWTDLTEEAKEELFRLCRSLLLLKNCHNTLDDMKHVLKQWFIFCDGNDGSGKNNMESTGEPNASAMLDNIPQFSKLIDEAISVCHRRNFTDYKFGKFKAPCTRATFA